jgi:hypothetical protein
MAFSGIPVVQEVTESLYRITGVELAGGASGTISLTSGAGEIKLPRSDDWSQYRDVTLQDAVQVPITLAAGTPPDAPPISVVKTGTVKEDFLITLMNTSGDDPGIDSGELEIYVRLH